MPLGKGVRYRMKGKVRLAFKGKRVVEAKNMKTGKMDRPKARGSHRTRLANLQSGVR